MDEEKLITEVKNHSMIYDNSHRFYKDNYKKEKAWKDIAEAMGVDGKSRKWQTNAGKMLFVHVAIIAYSYTTWKPFKNLIWSIICRAL